MVIIIVWEGFILSHARAVSYVLLLVLLHRAVPVQQTPAACLDEMDPAELLILVGGGDAFDRASGLSSGSICNRSASALWMPHALQPIPSQPGPWTLDISHLLVK
ncbi:hypothetical protein GGI42DRAFT_276525 [Trichoderma sp. SZMC 28013]